MGMAKHNEERAQGGQVRDLEKQIEMAKLRAAQSAQRAEAKAQAVERKAVKLQEIATANQQELKLATIRHQVEMKELKKQTKTALQQERAVSRPADQCSSCSTRARQQ